MMFVAAGRVGRRIASRSTRTRPQPGASRLEGLPPRARRDDFARMVQKMSAMASEGVYLFLFFNRR
ncbi:hypothetical protein BGZ61DRAFT_201078 [Ilyonectria robusta]|uniref:uncharacterized protein n=1 Tax=Ilyonectria robusta TaxID=1079257 RepID=UPI001E8DEF06|nr:uncharacterized protein BGZ61DRAFT_201078 [Ilyonectria robusta]KAH8722165.1 hypothetical protein BGZ61DRAFT_201078 [Ilyonectria robusta]